MPKCQCKKISNSRKGNMVSLEHSYHLTARTDQSNAAKAQENDLKNDFMKMIDVLKDYMNTFFIEIGGKTSKKKCTNHYIPQRKPRKQTNRSRKLFKT